MAKASTPKMTIPSSKVAINLVAGSTDAAMKTAEAKSGKLFRVPVGSIKPIPGFNVRVDSPDYREHRDNIAALIVANGYDETKPLAGYVAKEGDKNVIYVTDGHTRLDAVNTINADADNGVNIDAIPVIVRREPPSLTDLTVALHTNNTGRPLSPFELGVVVKRLLKEDGADKANIATRLGVTPRYLDDVLLLVNGPKEIRTAVLEGNVSSSLAIIELRKDPEKAVERITTAVKKTGGRVTKKALGAKMQKVRSTVSIATGTDMKEIVKAVAALVRKAIPASVEGEGDDAIKLSTVDGTINLVIEVPAPDKAEPKPAAKKATGKKAAAKPAVKSKAKDGDAAPDVKPAAKKATGKKAATKPEPKSDADADENLSADGDDDDLGIPGAEEVAPDGEDDEIAPVPIAVKSGEGTEGEEVDI